MVNTKSALKDPNQCKNGECKRRPVDESGVALMGEDGPERPSNCDGSRKISFRRREGVGGSSTLEEEQGEENEDFSPYTSRLVKFVNTESLESGQDYKNCCPTVVEREWQMNEEFI